MSRWKLVMVVAAVILAGGIGTFAQSSKVTTKPTPQAATNAGPGLPATYIWPSVRTDAAPVTIRVNCEAAPAGCTGAVILLDGPYANLRGLLGGCCNRAYTETSIFRAGRIKIEPNAGALSSIDVTRNGQPIPEGANEP